jgi:bacterioferritin (cytochrome b1)
MALSRYLRSEDPVAVQFNADLKAAEAAVEDELVGSVVDMAKDGNFHAAQWYLATKFQSRWANHAKELKEALKLLREIGEQRKLQGDASGQSPQD